jgi:hypothetical protein
MKRLIFLLFIVSVMASCSNQPAPSGNAQKDTLMYETITLIRTYQDCDPSDTSCTHISFSYPQFSDATPAFSDSMDHLVIATFSDPSRKISTPDSVQQVFIKDYTSFVKSYPDRIHPWLVEKAITVFQQNPQWVTLQTHEFAFAGGAHPNEKKYYQLLDRNNGKKLLLNHFFDSAAIYKLYALGEPLFCEQHHIRPDQGFDQAGFWFPDNHFRLNNNFYIHEDGITFYFNTYEVAPYAIGPTTITIPANKIMPLMKPEKIMSAQDTSRLAVGIQSSSR